MKWYDFFKRHKDGRHGRVGGDLVALSSSKGQAYSDRSCLRVFEEELARRQVRDWLSGSRDAQKSFSKCLIDNVGDMDIKTFPKTFNLREFLFV